MPATAETQILKASRPASAELSSSQVEALFSDVRSFAIGAGGVCVAALVVAWRAKSVALCVIAGLLALTAITRLGMMGLYRRSRTKVGAAHTDEAWERGYNISATIHITIISSFCLAVFLVTPEPLDRMLGDGDDPGLLLAGIPGRNFANPLGVDFQLVCGALPLMFAMVVAGGQYWILTCLLFLPYFVALRGLATRLRGIFVEATMRARQLSAMAARFDTALNNMSHGLAMFDERGRVTVYNGRLVEIMQLDPAENLHDQPIASLLIGAAEAQGSALAALRAHADVPVTEAVEIAMRNGSTLEFTFQPMPKGGAVALIQDITERKRAAARINQLALYDELTNLINRAQFRTILATRLAEPADGAKQALMFIDLDQFKQVNDTLGHSCGDGLIRQVANRLLEAAEAEDDIVARLGGDEFVVLRRFRGAIDNVEYAARKLIQQISQPYRVDGHHVLIGASIGISVFPDHDISLEQLLKKADLALYRAKADGRGSCRTFEPSMGVQAVARSELEFDLRQAVRNEEFELHYQPIYNLQTGRFSLCEALIRWRHPTRGLLAPGEFISVAEEMGLIVDIGKWVLKRACAECMNWPVDVRVAVNISPLQFRRGDIVMSVSNALEEAGLHPSRLELELTESVLLQDVAFTSLTMKLLHMRQVSISLDDFGTGYSSLSYMNELPLSKVKIDRSFLAGIEKNEKTLLMLRGLTRLSAELGLSVVIEGVETERQLQLITKATDVQEVQGYLFSRPLPAAGVRELLEGTPAVFEAREPTLLRLAQS